MPIDFSKQEIDIPCPDCGNKTKKTVGWLKTNHSFDCSHCHQTIQVEAKQLLKDIDDFNRKLGKMFK